MDKKGKRGSAHSFTAKLGGTHGPHISNRELKIGGDMSGSLEVVRCVNGMALAMAPELKA